jgi:hypothetical protein
VNLAEDEDRTEWDRVWRERPLRQLIAPVQIDFAPVADPAWGEVVRVTIAADPPQFADTALRDSEICPVCGKVAPTDVRMAATIYPHFASGFSYGLPGWVHETCLAACEEVAGPAPVPW